jgi:DNA-binding NtrC family response regulator
VATAVTSRVLLVCPDNADRRLIEGVLRHWGINVASCETLRDAQAALRRRAVRLVFCENGLEDGSYRDLLAFLDTKRRKPRAVVLTVGVEPEKEHLEALQSGAFDSISKPCSRSDVQWMVIHALQDHSDQANRPSPGSARKRRSLRRTVLLQ